MGVGGVHVLAASSLPSLVRVVLEEVVVVGVWRAAVV